MSRFVEILNSHDREISVASFSAMLGEFQSRLECESAYIEMHFPYFIDKATPVTGVRSLLDYQISFLGSFITVSYFGLTPKNFLTPEPITFIHHLRKAISEFSHELLIDPELVETRGNWGCYRLATGILGTEYRLRAKVLRLEHWHIDPDFLQ